MSPVLSADEFIEPAAKAASAPLAALVVLVFVVVEVVVLENGLLDADVEVFVGD